MWSKWGDSGRIRARAECPFRRSPRARFRRAPVARAFRAAGSRRTEGSRAHTFRRLGTKRPLHRLLSAMSNRPLSPHLGVYKFTYTMSLSILHRITGVATSIAFVAFAWWLMALASGPEAYAAAMHCLASPLAKLLLVGFTFSFVYHFCNGIRHLVWDTGRGLERAQARLSGVIVVVAALVFTAVIIWFACRAMGFSMVAA